MTDRSAFLRVQILPFATARNQRPTVLIRGIHATGSVESSAIPHDDAWFCSGGDVALEAAMGESIVEDWKTSVDGGKFVAEVSIAEPGSVCQVSTGMSGTPRWARLPFLKD